MVGNEECAGGDRAPQRMRGTALWYLGRAALRSQYLTQCELAAEGMRKWHYAVLACVTEAGPLTQAEIGRRLGVDRSDVVALLDDLEAEGYVSREPDPTDRRRNQVTATTKGKKELVRLDGLMAKANEELLAPLSTAERAKLLELLGRIAVD